MRAEVGGKRNVCGVEKILQIVFNIKMLKNLSLS